MKTQVDGSVYPDRQPPSGVWSLEQKADYLHRIVSAFDFGIPPDAATLRLLSRWQDVFDTFPLAASPGYHALRTYFGWPEIAKERFPSTPNYVQQDCLEGRDDDCVDRV